MKSRRHIFIAALAATSALMFIATTLIFIVNGFVGWHETVALNIPRFHRVIELLATPERYIVIARALNENGNDSDPPPGFTYSSGSDQIYPPSLGRLELCSVPTNEAKREWVLVVGFSWVLAATALLPICTVWSRLTRAARPAPNTHPRRSRLKGILRVAFRGLSILSALLFLATCALWVRSYWRTDGIFYKRREIYETVHLEFWKAGWLTTSGGGLLFDGFFYFADALPDRTGLVVEWGLLHGSWHQERGWLMQQNIADDLPRFLGFAYTYDYANRHTQQFRIPLAALCIVTAILPAISFRRLLRKRLIVEGQPCKTCGYDLRATPDRCPECGTASKGINP